MIENGPGEPALGAPDSRLLGICGWMGITGAVAIVVSNIVGSAVVPGYDWVSDTISDLAAGRHEIIQDVGLYGFAGSLMASALGAANVHTGTRGWTLGVLGLAVMGALVTVIGARNEYGDRDEVATWAVHLGLVYALMLLFLAVTVTLAHDLLRLQARCGWMSLGCAGLFVITAGAYFAAPNGYDGLVERAVGLVAIAWVVAFSWLLLDVRNGVAPVPRRAPRGDRA